jgi:CBS domain-containing protein
VAHFSPAEVQLKRSGDALRPLQLARSEIALLQDVLDRQIVDTDGAKVERVNDLHLLVARGELRVAHVDVGVRGLVRRMGWQKLVDGVVRTMRPKARYLTREGFVAWKYVQPLSAGARRVRLDLKAGALAELHPADLVEILEDLDRRERAVLFRELPLETAADTLEEAEPILQRELLSDLEPAKAADVLAEMDRDDAADLLAELPAQESQELLSAMEPQEARKVEELLAYDEDSAGGMMNPDFVRLGIDLSCEQAFTEVRRQARDVEHIDDVFILAPGEMLQGVVSLRDLLLAEPSAPLRTLMYEHPAPLKTDDRSRRVAELAAKYNLSSLPVVAEDGHLAGVVTIDDVLERVLHG